MSSNNTRNTLTCSNTTSITILLALDIHFVNYLLVWISLENTKFILLKRLHSTKDFFRKLILWITGGFDLMIIVMGKDLLTSLRV